MTIYYTVLDYCGWCTYRTLDGDTSLPWSQYQPIVFASTCRESVNSVCKLLNDRRRF